MKKVIVIGAGVGGLSVAARLLSHGYQVEIFEKNHTVGGKTNFLKHGNFKFDLTASILMFADNYIELFKYCNKDYKNYFNLIPLDNLYNVFFSDGSEYSFYSNLPNLNQTIKNITDFNTNDIYGYFNFLSSNYEKYLLAEKDVLNTTLLKPYSIFKALKPRSIFKYAPTTSCYDDIKKYINSEKLSNYLLFQSMYIGASPYSSPSIYNLIPTASQVEGLYHITGGMYSYIKALEKLVLEQGGIINTLSHVNKLIFKKNKAIGIEVNEKKYFADIIVCNSDYSYTLDTLIPEENIHKSIKPIDTLDYSCSVFMLYLALDKKYPSLNIHNIYINKEFKENIEATFNGNIPKYPSLYLYCPSSMDTSVCPKDFETLNIMVRVPNLLNSKFEWNYETIYSIKRKVLYTLSKINGLEDILDHIVYQKHLTPLDFEAKFNTYGGCAFGLSHTLNQSAFLRPQCQIPKLKNLFFTGASVHPGNGVAMVLKSSKLCAEMIVKKHSL